MKRILARTLFSQRVFEFFQRFGVHITPNHFYSPIPDTRQLAARNDLWKGVSDLVGVDLNVAKQLDLLENVFPKYATECEFPVDETAVPHEYFVNCGSFGLISAAVLHCFVRHFKPKTIIEVGSGYSTYVAARAGTMNGGGDRAPRLIAVEPYPSDVLRQGFPGLSELVPEKAEDVGPDLFRQLEPGDILFIDSSHVVGIGGDVNYLYLDVLPRLPKGVVIHIHDVYLPRHYPKDWVVRNGRFWTEQYLLQAFLAFNPCFEVLSCGSYLYLEHLDKLKSIFPPPAGLGIHENYFSSSFWMRRSA